MLKTETKKIGDLNVTVTQFAGRKNLGLLVDLAAFIAPSLAGVKGGKSFMDMDIDGRYPYSLPTGQVVNIPPKRHQAKLIHPIGSFSLRKK